MERLITRRLLTHLAQFSSFSGQGEVLCTRGLEYLLRDPEAKKAFVIWLTQKGQKVISSTGVWEPEACQTDRGRPDLQLCDSDRKPIVKIEAKLGATLSEAQLRSYLADLQARSNGGLLLILVPRHRMEEAATCAAAAVSSEYAGCVTQVVSWDEVLHALSSVRSEPFSGDLAQFSAMYRALVGEDIEPLRSRDSMLDWKQREGVFRNLVNRATQQLAKNAVRGPIAFEDRDGPDAYLRRYVCRSLGSEKPCFSVGARTSFPGYNTSMWLRFHHKTALFRVVENRLLASPWARELLLRYRHHIWIPLDVPLDAEGDEIVESLVNQVNRVADIVYSPLS